MGKQNLWGGGGWGRGQIRCMIGDVPVAHEYEAGYDKLINLQFVHGHQLGKKCVIFRLMPYASDILCIISMCNQMVTSEIIP